MYIFIIISLLYLYEYNILNYGKYYICLRKTFKTFISPPTVGDILKIMKITILNLNFKKINKRNLINKNISTTFKLYQTWTILMEL